MCEQVPGDGRELVVAAPDAVTVRAEDGRRIEATDISPYISNLPFGPPSVPFQTCIPSSAFQVSVMLSPAYSTVHNLSKPAAILGMFCDKMGVVLRCWHDSLGCFDLFGLP